MCTRRYAQNVHITTSHNRKKKINNPIHSLKVQGQTVEYSHNVTKQSNEMTMNHKIMDDSQVSYYVIKKQIIKEYTQYDSN